MNDLAGKVALVTGGAQGIGKGIAEHLLQQGMNVVIADHDPEAGRECIEQYRSQGNIRFIDTDVAVEDSVSRCVQQSIEAFGKLDALINNAAIADAYNPPIEQLSLEDWNRKIGVNLTGCFLTVKYAVPYLRQAHGTIVNIASTRALQSEPNSEAYAASKGALVALTHALAISLGERIRVNCISPGWIEVRDWRKESRRQATHHSAADRQQHPVGRVGRPQDVAALTAFLISEASGFVTGQNFIVDGGMTRKMIYVEE